MTKFRYGGKDKDFARQFARGGSISTEDIIETQGGASVPKRGRVRKKVNPEDIINTQGGSQADLQGHGGTVNPEEIIATQGGAVAND